MEMKVYEGLDRHEGLVGLLNIKQTIVKYQFLSGVPGKLID